MKFFQFLFLALIPVLLHSCSPKKEQFTKDLCYPTNREFKLLDINDDHLAVFNNDLKVTDRGHFLRGVYAVKDQMVYASVYEGPKKDSLLHALSDLEMSKTKLGDQYTWWANANTLFLNSSTQIVMVSFPQNLSTDIIPTNGQSILFELCD